ncbi:MAG: NAD(P)-dependent oxidoreductase [Bacteroidota bacterium]
MKTVAIIGASGYVGNHLVKALAPLFQVIALTRNDNPIVREVSGVEYLSISKCTRTFDIIINTSFSSAKEPKLFEQENLHMLKVIQSLSLPHSHIVHLSSLAVFGFALDRDIQPTSLPNRADYPYVRSKLHMENLLLQQFSTKSLSIVRLGNIWGPANQSWTQPVTDAIVWGLPVLSKHHTCSNLTYVHNITSYLLHIIQSEQHQTFHHLAEHHNISWQQVIDEIGLHLQLKPQPIDTIPFYPLTITDEVSHAVWQGPVNMMRMLKSGRFTSTKFPASILSLSVWLKSLSDKTSFPLPPHQTDPVFYWVLTTQKPFTNHLLKDWQPPYTWEQASKQTLLWLDEAGYTA